MKNFALLIIAVLGVSVAVSAQNEPTKQTPTQTKAPKKKAVATKKATAVPAKKTDAKLIR